MTVVADEVEDLSHHVLGPVLTATDSQYEAECTGFDLSTPQRPPIVIGASGRGDVLAAVRFARDHEMPVGVIATGHGVTAPANTGVLINTGRAQAIQIDPAHRMARLQPGVTWGSVLKAAAPYGLAPLCGSSPGVGTVGYTLGGGLGALGRLYGFAADHVRRVEIVTADGELRNVTSVQEPYLFWAVRGGGGNFGVVTELDIELMPLTAFYGGSLFYRGEDAAHVLEAFMDCTDDAPDDLTLSVAIITFPNLPALPEPLRGRFCVQVRVECAGLPDVAEDVIGPLRTVADVLMDTVAPMPFADIGTIHNDPTDPMPENVRTVVLREFDAGTIAVIMRHAHATTPYMIELRHLGGALSRQARVPNAVGHRGGLFNFFTSAYPSPAGFEAADIDQRRLIDDLRPWSDGGPLYTFLMRSDATGADVKSAFGEADFTRLRRIKAAWDPQNMFRFNLNIPPI